MDFVNSLDVFGVPAKEIPCIPGKGTPSASMGAVGLLYLDTDSGKVYVCITALNGVYGWSEVKGERGAQGTAGPAGTSGKSAYQYVKDAGYTGTEAEFGAALAALMSSGAGVPLPSTAVAGQFIRVKAVDGYGRIVATEAVTLSYAEGVSF